MTAPFTKGKGATRAEATLARMCERTFLSLWSYPGLWRDVLVHGKRTGKELCDVLVQFDNDVLIFSDKDCAVPNTGDLKLDWKRWFRRAISASVRQAVGAEEWVRQNPSRIFVDQQCTVQFPNAGSITADSRIHLIVVAHQISRRCHEQLGGSGSLMLYSDIRGDDEHEEPFRIGDVNPKGTFVHVLDDASLEVLMFELTTVRDFVDYLACKADFLRSDIVAAFAGEEELLAWYLRNVDRQGRHYFKLPKRKPTAVFFEEGHYLQYLDHPQRLAKVRADEPSYAWDRLIELFSHHALQGTQYLLAKSGVEATERILRFMAREPRTRRRMLAQKLADCIETTPSHLRRTAYVEPSNPGDPYYVFLMLPWSTEHSDLKNREVRLACLRGICSVVRLMYADAFDVVGIATESGKDLPARTEDAMYCDFRIWTEQDAVEAKAVQQELGILTDARRSAGTEFEFPLLPGPPARNSPCPCGSGRKFKRCCGESKAATPSRHSVQ